MTIYTPGSSWCTLRGGGFVCFVASLEAVNYDGWVFGASAMVSDSGLVFGEFGKFCMISGTIRPKVAFRSYYYWEYT